MKTCGNCVWILSDIWCRDTSGRGEYEYYLCGAARPMWAMLSSDQVFFDGDATDCEMWAGDNTVEDDNDR